MANGDRRLLRTRLDKQRRVLRRRFALFKTLLVHMRLLAGLTEIEKKSDDGVKRGTRALRYTTRVGHRLGGDCKAGSGAECNRWLTQKLGACVPQVSHEILLYGDLMVCRSGLQFCLHLPDAFPWKVLDLVFQRPNATSQCRITSPANLIHGNGWCCIA
jgi:hypothetical protein